MLVDRWLMEHSEARERVLRAAADLFAERGYAAVTIKEIAVAAGIHHASLYHHAPGGKQQLYVEVTERGLRAHQAGIEAAIKAAGDDLRAQLRGVAAWLLAHPPMDLIRMSRSDLLELAPDEAGRLEDMAFDVMFVPIVRILYEAQRRGDIGAYNFGNLAGGIFSAIEGLHLIPDEYLDVPRQQMADELIDVFIAGMRAP